MKKHFLFAALAVATLFTACSKEEELSKNEGSTPVNFVIGGVGARTTTTLNQDGSYNTVFNANDSIGIYAVGGTTVSNSKFTVVENEGAQSLNGEAISYEQDVKTTFSAYYPYSENAGSTVTMTVGSQKDGIDQYDLLTATAETSTASTIKLTFAHRMAMVQVQVGGEIGKTATDVTLKSVKPTVTWTAETNDLTEAAGEAVDIPMYRIDATNNIYVALVPAQTISGAMFSTTIGEKIYTFTPNNAVSLTTNNVSKFAIEIGEKTTMVEVGDVNFEIGGWTVATTVNKDFTMKEEEIPAAPAVELISATDFSNATLGTIVGGLKDMKNIGWAQVGAAANATVSLANGALTINASSAVSSSWYNRGVLFRSAPISNVTKYTLKFTVKSDKAEGSSDLQLAVMLPEAASNTWFKLNSNAAAGYCPVTNVEAEKTYTVDLTQSSSGNADYSNGILLLFTPKAADNITYTITNLTLVETKE